MRLIDADVLIARLDYCTTKGMGSTIAFTFKHMIDEQPTIDAVQVIRCKDCKYAKWDDERGDYICNGRAVWKNHYCGYAKRKGESK